jgi:glycosyltransferase involved in cell wall biosynthesis
VRIGIYNEPFGASVGGSEYLTAVLAEALGQSHDVELVHHRRALTMAQLEEFSGRDLSAVRLRYVEHTEHQFGDSHNPWSRYREARMWHASLSKPYELFIGSIHNVPPFCHAPIGVLMILFPLYFRPYAKSGIQDNSLWRALSRGYHKWEWKRRMETYQMKTAISEFTRTWTRRLWDIDCQVIHPPAASPASAGDKQNVILSVGRFAVEGEGHGKKQHEMLSVFRDLYGAELKDWQYYTVGNLGNSREHLMHFDDLTRIAAECRAHVLSNLPRNEVQSLFGRAKIFWHAAGYGDDEIAHPELSEHFGIVTVEAMAAGCVPVVINKGAQNEIVEHGISGYLWNDFEELKEYTLRLSKDDSLCKRMSEAARERAGSFSVATFQKKFLRLLQPVLD